MATLSRIPTPMLQHIRRFRFQVLPVLVFIGILVMTSMLWDHQRNRQWATGEVDDVSIDLSFNADGTLIPVTRPPEVMDTVRAGDVIAQLDPRPISEELAAMGSDLAGLRAELGAAALRLVMEQTDRRYDRLMDRRRLSLDAQRHQLDLLDRRTQLQTDRIALLRIEAEVAAIEQAFAEGSETAFTLQESRFNRDAAVKQVRGNEAAIEEAQAQLVLIQDRLAEHSRLGDPDEQAETLLAPIRHAIVAQEARIRGMELQREALAILSPIDGIITAVRYQPGQAVQAGVPVVKVTSIHSGDVISYLREGHAYRPRIGEKAFVRSRSGPRMVLTGTVQNVGPEYERLPNHQLRDPQRPEWGLPIRIALNENSGLVPGELVDVTFARSE